MDLFDLVAKITLDSSEYESGMKKLNREAASKAEGIKKSLLTFTKVGAAAAVAFGASAVKTGAQFDSAMSQVAATMGTTTDNIQELRNFAQEMGATTAFSATQAAEALNYMALAGYDAETSMSMLPTVLDLAAAGGIELASASDMVTDAQSALGLSLDETAELVDKMAKASSKSNTSVSQLGDAILTVGGTAKTLAGGTTELSTALGILADNGIKGAEGGTALRNIILALSAPTDTAAKKMAELGLEAYDASGNLRPMEDIFLDLNNALSTMTQGEQTEVLSTLFNKVDLKSANALLATSADRWEDLSGAIDDASGSAKAMANTQLDNLEGDITLLKSAFEGLQIQISDKLAPAFRKGVQFLTKLIDNFETVGPAIAGAATAIGVFAVAINIGSIIQKTAVAFKALNLVLAANPIGIVVALLAGLAVALVTLWKNNEKFRKNVTKVWNAISKFFSWTMKVIKKALSDGWDSIKKNASTKWNEIKNFLSKTWANIKATAIATWDAIKTAISSAIDKAKTAVTNTIGKLKSALSTAWSNIKSTASTMWNNIKTAITTPIQNAKNALSTAADNIKSALSTAWDNVKSTATTAWNGIKSAITKPIEEAKESVSKIWDTIKGFFDGDIKLNFKLPKITLGSKHWNTLFGPIDIPWPEIHWNKKAMEAPWMFSGATLFGAGEAGDEILYGRSALMNDIKEAVKGTSNATINITVNAAPGMDENALADKVARKLQQQLNRRQAVWA